MYYYIFDQGNLPIDKFEQMQTEITGLTAEFKISGETARITPLRSISDLVETASERGVKTLVVCGSDDTFNLVLAALKGRDFVLGFVPMDEKSYLGKILGQENIFSAVKAIAGRRLKKIDLAKIGNNYFVSFLEFGVMSQKLQNAGLFASLKMLSSEPKNVMVRIDDSYNVSIKALGGLILNSRSTSCKNKTIANPTDSYLDLLLLESLTRMQILRFRKAIAEGCLEQVPKTTIIKCKKIELLEPFGMSLSMLGRMVTKLPTIVEIVPQRLRIIVGKNRTF